LENRTEIPIQAEPSQVSKSLRVRSGLNSGGVDVLDSKNDLAVMNACVKPVY